MSKRSLSVFLLLLIAAMMFLSGCGDNNEETDSNEEVPEEGSQQSDAAESNATKSEEKESDKIKSAEIKEDELGSVLKHFEDNGFERGEEQEKAAEMVGAIDGFGIELNGTEVELYVYEEDSTDLEEIKENNEYDMDGFVFPAIANETIVLINHDEHPEEEEVVEVFKEY